MIMTMTTDRRRDRYLEWLVGYQFPALTSFFARVEDLVVTVGAADVTYHEPRRNLEATLKKQGDMKVGSVAPPPLPLATVSLLGG